MTTVETSQAEQGSTYMAAAVPDPGQIVNVRGANWAVTDVQQQSLPRSAQDDAVQQLQHAVTLRSVEDDRLGDELRVVWELEPGRSLHPPQDLPTEIDPERFDDPARLAAFVDALRWGAVTSADDKTVQAPFRSGARVEPYQLEPLVRALRAPRVNLLLADDVGLGKTIEAGLVIQELFLRHRARTAMVVCPAGLTIKWQEEMAEKFGLDFTIINSETMREVRRTHGVHANPFTLFPRIIVSMSWLPGARAQRQLRDAFHARDREASRFTYDILVVDEAQHVVPSAPTGTDKVGRRRGYAVDSQRTRAVRDLAERSEHRLFLSATPHNGYTESFTALLEMIDPQRFVRGPTVDKQALEEVAVRRLKRDIPGQFVDRTVSTLSYDPTERESEAYDRLLRFTDRRNREVANDSGRHARDMATLLLKKRFFSSPVAFAQTLDVYRDTRTRGLDVDFDALYDDVVGADADDQEEGRSHHPEMATLRHTKQALPPLTEEDLADLDWLSDWGHGYDARPDSRLDRLIEHLEATLFTAGEWNNERIVVFTEYVDTLEWIHAIFRQRGWENDRIGVIEGQTDADDRELIRAKFNEDPAKEPIRILLATDAAGEGIDLQNHCHRLVNFDIPFNPNRLEQRIGRVDRYGQRHAPDIRHFAPNREHPEGLTADVDLLSRVATKVGQIMEDLGSANEIIAPDIQRQLGGMEVVPRKPRAEKDPIGDLMAGGRGMGAELTELAERLTTSRDTLHLRPANLQRVVETAFELDHKPPMTEVGSERTDAPVLRLPDLDRTWEQVTRGLTTRLDPEHLRPVAFDPQVLGEDPDVVYMHLGSALLQRATRRLRSALWGTERSLERVTAVVVPGLEESFAAAVTRLVLLGRAGLRLHEEVFLAGTRLAKRQNVGAEKAGALLEQALDAETIQPAPDEVVAQLAKAWNDEAAAGLRSRVADAVTDRVQRRCRDVEEQLQTRHTRDRERVEEIFDRFGTTLSEALREAEELADDPQLGLFDDERRQSERDLRQIRERIEALADERERELAAVDARYADVQPRTFHAAVVFALSPADAERATSEGGVTIR